jgi:hypothetical protein
MQKLFHVFRAESVFRCDICSCTGKEKKRIQFAIQNIHRVESLWMEEERNIDRKPSGITVQKYREPG